jgi:hypothetical protein
MHLRRAVLLMAVIFVTVGIVGALVPVPEERAADKPPRPAPSAAGAAPVKTLSLRYPAPEKTPQLRVDAGSHVILQVASSEPGQVTVQALGLAGEAEPRTPARFDLLATRPGRFTVAFVPAAGGEARTVGTLAVVGTE